MTSTELDNILKRMNESEFAKFSQEFGGGSTREGYVKLFVQNPQFEEQLCQILKVPTEANKHFAIAEASLKAEKEQANAAHSANAIAAAANQLAHRSNVIATIAVIISVLALIVAVYAAVTPVAKP